MYVRSSPPHRRPLPLVGLASYPQTPPIRFRKVHLLFFLASEVPLLAPLFPVTGTMRITKQAFLLQRPCKNFGFDLSQKTLNLVF